jgi:restriction endonuclease S subunit
MKTAPNKLSWIKKPTKHIFSILNGVTPSTFKSSYWNGNIYWATPEDIKTAKGKFIFDTKRKITQQAFDNCAVKLAPVGSIILTSRANIGNLALAGVELCTNQSCKALVPKSKDINTDYFYYQLLARKQELLVLAKGTTFQELATYDLQNFELWLPSIALQNNIANYLDCEIDKLNALIVAKKKFQELLIERRRVINYTVKNDTRAYLQSHSKHNNFTYISTANIKQLHAESITSKLDELINTTNSTIKLLYERRTALIEAAISGRLHAIM